MTEKNIFAYKLFLSLNISDFNLFLYENCNPPWNKALPLFQQPPSKSWGSVKPPIFENFGLEAQLPRPPVERGGGGWPLCGGNKKVKAAGLFKYLRPFCYNEALKS